MQAHPTQLGSLVLARLLHGGTSLVLARLLHAGTSHPACHTLGADVEGATTYALAPLTNHPIGIVKSPQARPAYASNANLAAPLGAFAQLLATEAIGDDTIYNEALPSNHPASEMVKPATAWPHEGDANPGKLVQPCSSIKAQPLPVASTSLQPHIGVCLTPHAASADDEAIDSCMIAAPLGKVAIKASPGVLSPVEGVSMHTHAAAHGTKVHLYQAPNHDQGTRPLSDCTVEHDDVDDAIITTFLRAFADEPQQPETTFFLARLAAHTEQPYAIILAAEGLALIQHHQSRPFATPANPACNLVACITIAFLGATQQDVGQALGDPLSATNHALAPITKAMPLEFIFPPCPTAPDSSHPIPNAANPFEKAAIPADHIIANRAVDADAATNTSTKADDVYANLAAIKAAQVTANLSDRRCSECRCYTQCCGTRRCQHCQPWHKPTTCRTNS
ncbi:hypothetical protein L7F22_050945 [Adiantum nelumboides]|nr:hypothetical protein [Adiantum nelumboides]